MLAHRRCLRFARCRFVFFCKPNWRQQRTISFRFGQRQQRTREAGRANSVVRARKQPSLSLQLLLRPPTGSRRPAKLASKQPSAHSLAVSESLGKTMPNNERTKERSACQRQHGGHALGCGYKVSDGLFVASAVARSPLFSNKRAPSVPFWAAFLFATQSEMNVVAAAAAAADGDGCCANDAKGARPADRVGRTRWLQTRKAVSLQLSATLL